MRVMRRVGSVLACATLSLALGNPALATHTAEHAAEQIGEIVADAVAEMRSRVATFEAQAESATSESEIEAFRQAARSDVHAIWSTADTKVKETAKGYDNELGSEVPEAKQKLVQARNDASADIDAAAKAAQKSLSPPPTTTTTTAPTTPTTVTHTTTTRAQATTTTQPGVTTSTQGGGVPPTGGSSPPLQQTPLELWAAQAFVSGRPEPSDGATRTPSGLSVALETVLPRDLIDWAMSPFRILRVIFQTTVDGGRSVLYPAAALAISAIILGVIEARLRHRASSRRRVSTG